jgi:hypothetical protein
VTIKVITTRVVEGEAATESGDAHEVKLAKTGLHVRCEDGSVLEVSSRDPQGCSSVTRFVKHGRFVPSPIGPSARHSGLHVRCEDRSVLEVSSLETGPAKLFSSPTERERCAVDFKRPAESQQSITRFVKVGRFVALPVEPDERHSAPSCAG